MSVIEIIPAASPPCAELSLPGSKSITNRALILAALGEGESVLRKASLSDDSLRVIEALERVGTDIKRDGSTLSIRGLENQTGFKSDFKGAIDIGPAGTAMRFLTAFFAVLPGCEVLLTGSPRMLERPIRELVSALRCLGADIEYDQNEGFPPLKIRGRQLRLTEPVKIDGSISSQYLSALLLIGAHVEGGMVLEVSNRLVSAPYLKMTLNILERFGVKGGFNDKDKVWINEGTSCRTDLLIEPDISGASYFWAIAAITGGRIVILDCSSVSVQGDMAFLNVLERMGCQIELLPDSRGIAVTGPRRLTAVKADFEDMPDVAQTAAVISAFSTGTTELTGLSTLRIKETDRIVALETELSKLGAKVKSGQNLMSITGSSLSGGCEICTYEDHRMAMAFAVAAVVLPGIKIENSEVVNKSFPSFWETIKKCGVEVVCG